MSYGLVLVFEGVTEKDYWAVNEKLGIGRDGSGEWPEGMVFHTGGPTDGGRWVVIELWKSKGRLFREGKELFGTASWVAVLLGQGIVPDDHEPAADALDETFIADRLDRMRLSYRRMAEQMPTHAQFIARACPAPAVAPS